jgi:hypothetical protein
MRFLKQINHILIWIESWLAMDIFLLYLFKPDSSTKGFVLSMFIGAVAYIFADWSRESIYWLVNCILDWLAKKGQPKE